MCGVAGIVGRADNENFNAVVASMIGSLEHRGPDDSGVWADDDASIVLGHRRLAIVDLSPAGHQPMLSGCSRYVMSFNGEIYNHLQIRKELEKSSGEIGWRGHSDTEVFLEAVSLWGVRRALSMSIGMFSFALWDRHERELTLARDRIGEKPLYFGVVRGRLAFGSELKALRSCPGWSGEIDRDALAQYMRFGCISAPRTIYRNVYKLPPASVLNIPCRKLDALDEFVDPARADRYWCANEIVTHGARNTIQADDREACELLEKSLDESVALQMEADVPLGAFLSGGVDSSLITAMMQARSSRRIKTFSIGFEDSEYNEAEHAKLVAEHLGTDHTEQYLSAADAIDVVPMLPTLYDEPFADASQIPTFLVSQVARREVTVSLSGDGGDELFGGYNRHIWIHRLFDRANGIVRPGFRTAGWLLQQILAGGGENRLRAVLPSRFRKMQLQDRLAKLASVLQARSIEDAYLRTRSQWANPEQLVVGASEPLLLVELKSAQIDVDDAVQHTTYLDLVSYLPDDILVKLDRASMGVSLESRVPFLDHRLVELAWRLPTSMKIRDGRGKWLLRNVLEKYVPSEIIDRPKAGFSLPIHDWLRGPLQEWAESLLSEHNLADRGVLNPGPIRERWKEHQSGVRNWQHQLWCVLMFQEWQNAEKDFSMGAVRSAENTRRLLNERQG